MRSMAERSSGSSRRYSMKPVGLPMVENSELRMPNSKNNPNLQAQNPVCVSLESNSLPVKTTCRFKFRHSDFFRISTLSSTDARHIPDVFLKRGHDSLFAAQAGLLNFFHGLENALVIFGHDLDEFGNHLFPLRQDFGRAITVGIGLVALNDLPDVFDFVGILHFLELDHLRVAASGKIAGFIQNIGHAARHSGCEIASGWTQD